MIHDDDAWTAILAARHAWRAPGPRARVETRTAKGVAIALDPDGRYAATGVLSPAADATLAVFAPIAAAPRFALAQLGQSLDGRVATRSGRSHYINGPDALRHLHRLRAMADAVVVGAGTVASDDPQLTVRRCPGPSPVRVVIDPTGRLPRTHRVFTGGEAATLVVRDAASVRADAATIALPRTPAGIAPRDVLAALGARGLHRILVEGGPATIARFLVASTLDALHVLVAPLVLGAGREAFPLPGVDSLDEALRAPVHHQRLGDDMLFVLRLS